MHVVLLNYDYRPGFATAEALLDRFATLTGCAEGLVAAGAEVTVLQRFNRDRAIERRGITYRFVADRYGMALAPWQIPMHLHRLARATRPALAHINGLFFPLQACALRALLPRRCAIVAQHHGERPVSGARGVVQRWGLRSVDGFLFAARELAQPWVCCGMIRSLQPIYEIMEGSSWFTPQARAQARAATGMYGDPVVLWVGRLNDNKDPLIALAGFEQALERAPGARLYMIYSDDSLVPQVRARIAASDALRRSVDLLGLIRYSEIERFYNSADYFLLGSHHEGSGYALAEALACGVVPIVTDIPSFRMMTDSGRIGALWRVGDSEALAAALVQAFDRPRAPSAAAARAFFEARLSFEAIGQQALAAYRELVARRER